MRSLKLNWNLNTLLGWIKAKGGKRAQVVNLGAPALGGLGDVSAAEGYLAGLTGKDRAFVEEARHSLASVVPIYLLGILKVARQMSHKDLAVIFGRDMYPAIGAMAAWAPRLRGTWVYAEGASRDLAAPEVYAQKAHKVVPQAFLGRRRRIMRYGPALRQFLTKLAKRRGSFYGVDTGFVGTVPRGCLQELALVYGETLLISHENDEGLLDKAVLLYLKNTLKVEEQEERLRTLLPGHARWLLRAAVLAAERAVPKPFASSAKDTGAGGWPLLRLAGRRELLVSLMMVVEVHRRASWLLSHYKMGELLAGAADEDLCKQIFEPLHIDFRRGVPVLLRRPGPMASHWALHAYLHRQGLGGDALDEWLNLCLSYNDWEAERSLSERLFPQPSLRVNRAERWVKEVFGKKF